jgi:hypothetical protein
MQLQIQIVGFIVSLLFFGFLYGGPLMEDVTKRDWQHVGMASVLYVLTVGIMVILWFPHASI